MCGIAGYFAPEDIRPEAPDLGAMMRIMRHRGPDGDGKFISPDHRFQTGFVRLSIIDIETGDQPITSADGQHVLVGNGEIYNYVELRGGNDLRQYPYRTKGDMEVALPLYRKHGPAFVHYLNGMYGLALYDQGAHALILVRDRLGVKPLYWVQTPNGGLVFASEIKALFASGLVVPKVDETAVSAYMAHGYVPSPQTLFSGVRKVPPGCYVTVARNGQARTERYWSPTPNGAGPNDRVEVEQQLLDLFKDSVRMQLRSDVSVGALLSGGIDSGLMVAIAAEMVDKPLKTFTVRFQGAAVDETPLAAAVSRQYGTDHHEIEVSADMVEEHLPRLAWFCEEPLSDPALLPNALIEEQLASSVRVALNGTGGDELFAGYGRYFQLPIERKYLMLPRALRHGVVEPLVGCVAPMRRWQLSRAEHFGADGGRYLHEHTTYFPRPIREMIGNRLDPVAPAQSAFFDGIPGPRQTRMLGADLATYLPEDLLTLLDRTSMAHSVEGRVPYLDHRLVAAALAVPPEIRTPMGRQKALLRDIAARYLPSAVIAAPKRGFASPVPTWMGAGLGQLTARLLTQPRALERGWWTAEGIHRLSADVPRHAFRLYALLMLELSIRIHVEDALRLEPFRDPLSAYADAA